MDSSTQLEATYKLKYSERLRAGWDLSFGSPLAVLWLLFFPALGATLLWTMSWPTSRNTDSDYLLVFACFAFVPGMFLWNAFRAQRADRAKGPYIYRFSSEGIHVTTPTSELTHRWPAILRVRSKGGMLYLYFTKTCAHCVPLRALPSAGSVANIENLAGAGGVLRVGT